MERKEYERICELTNKLADGNPCVFADVSEVPETFAVDMAELFGSDPKNDVLRNVIKTYDMTESKYSNSCLIVVPYTIEGKELFIKLADYVNGQKIRYIWCCCKDKNGNFKEYEIDESQDYVEGGNLATFIDYGLSDDDITLDINKLALGATDPTMPPHPIVQSIKNGVHYTESLYGPDDEKLI